MSIDAKAGNRQTLLAVLGMCLIYLLFCSRFLFYRWVDVDCSLDFKLRYLIQKI